MTSIMKILGCGCAIMRGTGVQPCPKHKKAGLPQSINQTEAVTSNPKREQETKT